MPKYEIPEGFAKMDRKETKRRKKGRGKDAEIDSPVRPVHIGGSFLLQFF